MGLAIEGLGSCWVSSTLFCGPVASAVLGLPPGWEVISAGRIGPHATALVRASIPVVPDAAWTVHEVSLEDLVLAYMSRATPPSREPVPEVLR